MLMTKRQLRRFISSVISENNTDIGDSADLESLLRTPRFVGAGSRLGAFDHVRYALQTRHLTAHDQGKFHEAINNLVSTMLQQCVQIGIISTEEDEQYGFELTSALEETILSQEKWFGFRNYPDQFNDAMVSTIVSVMASA